MSNQKPHKRNGNDYDYFDHSYSFFAAPSPKMVVWANIAIIGGASTNN
jgi:hypothetical protein